MATVDIEAINEKMESDFLKRVDEIDAILLQIADSQKGIPNAAQRSYFAQLGWDVSGANATRGQRNLRREIARRARVLTHLEIVGDREQRAKLAEAAAQAQEALATEGRELAEKIAEWTRQLNKLESKAAQLAKRQQDVEASCEALRELAPAELQDHASNLRLLAKSDEAWQDIDAEYKELRAIAEMVPGSKSMMSYCSVAQNMAIRPDERGRVNSTSFDAFQADAREKLALLTPKWQAAKDARDAAIAASSAPRDFYLLA